MLDTFLPFYCMSFILAGLDCVLAGWGLSQEIPKELAPENLKILNVQTYDKRNCNEDPIVETSKKYLCAGVPGNTSQAACPVTTEGFIFMVLKFDCFYINLQRILENCFSKLAQSCGTCRHLASLRWLHL